MLVTLGWATNRSVVQRHKSWSKDDAISNMPSIKTADPTFQGERSTLKSDEPQNMELKSVTEDTSQPLMSPLKLDRKLNMEFIETAELVSHMLMSVLKAVVERNMKLKLVTPGVCQYKWRKKECNRVSTRRVGNDKGSYSFVMYVRETSQALRF